MRIYRHHAFSLIELIIVLAIMSVLLSLAYPSYRVHVIKTNRINVEIALVNLAAKLEEYYNEYNTYAGASLIDLGMPKISFYQVVLNETTATGYLIEAIPEDEQANADKNCGGLRLDQLGNKTITGTGRAEDCW